MPTRDERPDDIQFTLEEIIAEVKSERTAARPPVSPAPSQAIDIPLEQQADALEVWLSGESKTPPPPRRRAPAPARSADLPGQTALDALAQEAPPPAKAEAPKGRHAAAEEPSPVERLLADLPEPEEPRPPQEKQSAPWRTAPARPAPRPPLPEEEGEEDEDETESSACYKRAPRLPLSYDLLNHPFDDPAEAAEHFQRALQSLSSRLLLMIPVLVTSVYLTVCAPLGLPVPFDFTYINHPYGYQLAFCILQVLALLIAAPSTAAGLWRLVHGRPTLDTLVLFSGLCSLAHSASVIFRPEWGGYLPYTCVSALTCLFALMQKRQRAATLRRGYKALVMGTILTGLKLHIDGNRIATAVKTVEGGHAEPEALAVPDTTERFSSYFAPLALVCCAAFAAVASFGRGEPTRFLWALAALSSVCAPAGLLLSASAPAKRLSKKLFTSGSTLVSGPAAKRLARAGALVLEDADLFPAGSVGIAGMKVADNQRPEDVIACAAALVQEIGGGVSRAFSDMAREQYIAPLRASDLRFFETGGISGHVGNSYVLLGSVNFLVRMGVRVSEGHQLKNSLFLAIDGAFAAIFSLRYGVQPPVYAAFGLLRRAHVQPVLALRDFNTGQAFVEERFDLPTDSTEYPVLSERLRLSALSYAREEETLAVLSRDGLMPAAEALAAARQLTRAARMGRVFGLMSAVVGLLLLYFLCWRGAFAAAAPYNVLLYLLLWALPADLVSRVMTRL